MCFVYYVSIVQRFEMHGRHFIKIHDEADDDDDNDGDDDDDDANDDDCLERAEVHVTEYRSCNRLVYSCGFC